MPAKTIQHFLVPKHILLPMEEAEKLLKKFGARHEQMPQILRNDPAIKEFRVQKDDIIKIVRDSATAGKAIYYRRVV